MRLQFRLLSIQDHVQVDIGSHDELMRRDSLYVRLAELQFGEARLA